MNNAQNLNLDITKPPPNFPSNKHASHSFSQRPSPAQIAAYIIIAAQLIIFFTCIFYSQRNWVLFALYIVTGAFMIASAIITSCSNPTDATVYRYKWSKVDKRVDFESDFTQSYYCEYCDSFCSLKSKHCKICNRCVERFDHHCIWINNCVGDKNYKVFFILILSTFLHMVLFLIAGGLMSNSKEEGGNNITQKVFVWIMMFVLGVLGILLMQLIILHIYLQCKNITTYEFLQERKKMQQMQKIQEQRKIQQQLRLKEQEKKRNLQNAIAESQESNAGINMGEQKIANIQKVIKVQNNNRMSSDDDTQTQMKPASRKKMKTLQNSGFTYHQKALRKNEGGIEQEKEEDDISPDMPRLGKKNSSLKYLFGSSEAQSPRKSRRMIKNDVKF